MGERATELGVDMYTGFAGDDFILGKINSQSQTKGIAGVTTNDFGISKDLKLKENYQRGISIRAKQTVLAEGCRGSLSQRAIK
jgi:electron-transferring-flavoprotein dehydrogenase